jgi:PAS domain S-box-containing protein
MTGSAAPDGFARLDDEALTWLLDSTSDAISVRRLDDLRLIRANRAFANLVGQPLERLLGTTAVEVGLADEASHRAWLEGLSDGSAKETDADLDLPGGVRRVHVISRVLDVGGVPCSVSVLRDLTERHLTKEALERKDRILEAVTFAADRFLRASWREGIADVLRRLGAAAAVSRVYVFELVDSEAGGARILAAEWHADGIEPLSTVGPYREVWHPIGSGRWDEVLRSGRVIHSITRNLPPEERERLRRDDVLSALSAPIFSGQTWWGELGFDDCVSERQWSDEEVDALRTAAGILGASVHREDEHSNRRVAEERYRALVEQIPAVVYVDAVEGPDTTVYISPQTTSMLGFTQDEWMADPGLLSKRIHPEDRERWRTAIEHADRTGESLHLEYRFVRADDSVVWLHDQAVLVHGDGGVPPVWQGVMFDITDRRATEDALREAFERERTAAARLRALDEMKNTFLQAVSHELRTPLTAILGAALTLERQDLDLSQTEAHDLLTRLAGNARKLHRLLGDLLDLDRLSRGIIEPSRHPTDVSALIRGVLEDSQVVGERPVELDLDGSVVEVDAPKLERIVENLLANAARHTPPGTQIWVRVRTDLRGMLLVVEDAGSGIPAELRESVFEPFRQVGPTSPHQPGVGVGLALVARFAELHGGRTWVEERPGGGSSFRVFLPHPEVAEAEAARRQQAGEGPAPAAPGGAIAGA